MSALPHSYIHHQASVVLPYLSHTKTLLDFGCGDMAMDRLLIQKNKGISITGVDVTPEIVQEHSRLQFLMYDGVTLPFKNNTFDTVLAYHVFHHCDKPEAALKECIRVSKKHILIVEPLLRHPLEKPFFMILDVMTNLGRQTSINMPWGIRTRDWWHRECRVNHVRIIAEKGVHTLPLFLPIGAATLFSLRK